MQNLKRIRNFEFFVSINFKGICSLRWKLISFFVARYLTVSLRGPVLTLRQGRQAEFLDCKVDGTLRYKTVSCCKHEGVNIFPGTLFDPHFN